MKRAHNTYWLVVCRAPCAKVVGATSSGSFLVSYIIGESTGKGSLICIALFMRCSSLKRSGMARVNEESHVFTARRNARIASAVLATAIPSACLSVCPSHAGIVSKRLHVARCSLHRWIAKCV